MSTSARWETTATAKMEAGVAKVAEAITVLIADRALLTVCLACALTILSSYDTPLLFVLTALDDVSARGAAWDGGEVAGAGGG